MKKWHAQVRSQIIHSMKAQEITNPPCYILINPFWEKDVGLLQIYLMSGKLTKPVHYTFQNLGLLNIGVTKKHEIIWKK